MNIKDTEKSYITSALSSFTKNNKIIITPHVGGTALESQEKAYNRVIEKMN